MTNSRTKHMALTLLAVGFPLGVVVWAFPRWLTGKVEPWDSDAPIWPLSWLLLAVLGDLVGQLRGVCPPLGYALGQTQITRQSVFIGEFGVLAWVFIGGYAAAAVAATLAVLGVTASLKRLWRRRSALP